MRAKAADDSRDDIDWIKKMAYEAQSKILDIEQKILAKDGGPRKKEANPIIIPLDQNHSSPSKGNKSANRVAAPQQQQKLVAEVKKVIPTQRRDSEPPVDKKKQEEDERKKKEEAKKQFIQNQKNQNKEFVQIMGMPESHDDQDLVKPSKSKVEVIQQKAQAHTRQNWNKSPSEPPPIPVSVTKNEKSS